MLGEDAQQAQSGIAKRGEISTAYSLARVEMGEKVAARTWHSMVASYPCAIRATTEEACDCQSCCDACAIKLALSSDADGFSTVTTV